jgi:hypothetical protein
MERAPIARSSSSRARRMSTKVASPPVEKGPSTVISHTRRGTLIAAITALATLAVLMTAIAAPTARSASGTTCRLSESERYPHVTKPTYNLSLKVRGTSCATGKKVMKAFHACRSVTGVRCTKKVLRSWSCTGKKTASIPSQFDGSFTCTYGSRRVDSAYQQNTPG